MTKQKILIADDEAQIREILRIYFEKEDFQVIEAEDGAAAILKVQSDVLKMKFSETDLS